VSFVDSGLQDLSVSRTSLKWGIPVPDDPAHVMYVWFDALTNYMTAVGFGADGDAAQARFERFWPADVHWIGKEIVRQHGVYWPAFLMAAELPVPRQLASHGWWLMDGAKMSKSLGNVVRPADYISRFGVDALRYFVMREMVFGQDASFTDEGLLGRYNADLANDFGNLVSRATTMVHRYRQGEVPAAATPRLADGPERELGAALNTAVERVKAAVRVFQFSVALREIWDVIGATNRYIVTREPWTLAKDAANREALDTTLYVAADGVRVIAELLRPFMPETGERTLKMLGIVPSPRGWASLGKHGLTAGTKFGETRPLFPRIEQTVEELRQMSDQPEPTAAVPAPAAATPAAPAAALRITIDDFMKVELRVAKVLAAERVPKSKKLIKLQVDVGTEQRTLVAGIAESYEPEALVGRTVVIVFNLQPATLMGVESNGMVLAGSPDGGKPTLVGFETPLPPGTRVR
jgi:methionyl-tRNA synthetase